FPLWFFKVPFGDMGLYYIVSSGKKIRCLTDTMSVYRIHSQGIFHGKSNIQQKKQHLQFHRLLYPSLQAEEKVISKKKMQQYVKEIARKKYPKSQLIQFIYQIVFLNLYAE